MTYFFSTFFFKIIWLFYCKKDYVKLFFKSIFFNFVKEDFVGSSLNKDEPIMRVWKFYKQKIIEGVKMKNS